MKKIFLVGLPGTGKSTLGQKLGDALNLKFIDLDVEIERATGKLIRDIFQDDGESEFRKIEHETLQAVTENTSSFILATGGGTPCFFEHMSYMNQEGLTIYLSTPIEVIADRIKENNDRPLMAGADVKEKITSLLKERHRYYKLSSVHIDTSRNSFQQMAEEIKKAAERRFN